MATHRNEIESLVNHLKDQYLVRDKTEAQAIALASTSPSAIYYTSDTHKIVVGGHVYGMGSIPIANESTIGGIELALGNLGSSITDYCDQFGESECHLMLKEATSTNSGAMSIQDKVKLDKLDVDYSKQYMTFEAITAGTITIKLYGSDTSVAKTISYSLNGGGWTNLTTSTTEQSLGTFAIGDKIRIKGSNLRMAATVNSYNFFGGTAEVNVCGNIMSLIYGDSFIGKTTIYSYSFFGLFKGWTTIKSAKNLILPATTLDTYCYGSMFRNCSGLVEPPMLPATTLANDCYDFMFGMCTAIKEAPELPATTLVSNCYYYMFSGCSNLSFVKALFTTTPTGSLTPNWLNGVATSGIFIKSDDATWTTTGTNGVPTSWTVYTETSYKEIRKGDVGNGLQLTGNTLSVKQGSGVTVDSSGVSVNTPNMPIYMDGNGKLTIALGAAMEVSSSTASWKYQTSKGLDVDTSGAKVKLGTGMDFDSSGNIKPVADYGVKVDTGGIQLNLYDNGGLMLANAGHQVSVKAGSNIIVNSSGVSVDTDSTVTQNGTKPPTSGAVYTAIANATPNIEIMTQAEVATVGANVFGF